MLCTIQLEISKVVAPTSRRARATSFRPDGACTTTWLVISKHAVGSLSFCGMTTFTTALSGLGEASVEGFSGAAGV